MTYSEKLKDPRWQKRRLEVLERDEWACYLCGDDTTTLHVHHESYHGEPWETPLNELKCCCAHCHASIECCKKTEPDQKPISAIKAKSNGVVRIFVLCESDTPKFKNMLNIFDYYEGDVNHVITITDNIIQMVSKGIDSLNK